MTRVIKARALTDEQHAGLYLSHHGAAEPTRLIRVTTSLTFVYLWWPGRIATSVPLGADITIHDEP